MELSYVIKMTLFTLVLCYVQYLVIVEKRKMRKQES